MNNRENFLRRFAALVSELEVPKSKYNEFGKYKYRKAEDILDAVKPLLNKHEMTLVVSDRMVQIGERYYVASTAIVTDCLSGEEVKAEGWAREEEDKKGMDQSQITGASSSYARKYALNGLFSIDDSVDSDSTNTHGKEASSSSSKPQQKRTASTSTGEALEPTIMDSAVNYIKTSTNKQKAYEAIVTKYGEKLTPNQMAALKKFVR